MTVYLSDHPCTAQLPKFVAYPSSSLAFFDNMKASSQLSILVQLYIIIISMYSICFGINIAYPEQFPCPFHEVNNFTPGLGRNKFMLVESPIGYSTGRNSSWTFYW